MPLFLLAGPLVANPSDHEQLRIPTFEDPVAIEMISPAGFVAPALFDLDGDRDLDLVVGLADGTLAYFQNEGNIRNASFVETVLATLGSIDVGFRATPVFADLDRDGDQDLIVGAADGALHYFKNTGNSAGAVFVEQTGPDNPFDGLGVASNAVPTVGDIDGDNLLDVLVGAADGSVKIFSNTGTVVAPAFTELTGTDSFLDGVDFGDDAAPSLGDFEGDTDVDLVVGNAAGTFVSYLNGRGGYQGDSLTAVELPDVPEQGRYEPGVVLVDTGWNLIDVRVDPFAGRDLGEAATCAFGDLDADGDADLITGDSSGAIHRMSSNRIKKLVGIRGTHGVDGNPHTEDLGPYSGLAYHPKVSEETILDPDATTLTLTDELIRGSLGSLEELFEFNWAPPGDTGFYRTFWYTRAAGDLDGDGLLDMVTLESSIKGHATWKTSISWKSADQWNLWGLDATSVTDWIEDYNDSIPEFLHGHVDLADLDKDGDLDLIVAGNADAGNHLGYYENTGDATSPNFVRRVSTGNLVKDITFDSARSSIAPKFADLDGDGDLDCAVGIDFGQIAYWENTTSGGVVSFTEKGTLAEDIVPRWYTQPMFGDFDRDGDLDLVVHQMARRHIVHPFEHVNANALMEERYFPSEYLFFKNTGSAVRPVFEEVRSSFTDWDEQAETGNPVYRVYRRSRDTWPVYWDETSDDTGEANRSTDGLDRFLIGDFNYDGYPDIHYMRQEVVENQDCVWNYFYRTTEDTFAPTVTMTPIQKAPFYNSETFEVLIAFDEKVDRVDLSDFELTNDGLPVDLSAAILSGSGSSRVLDLTPVGLTGGDYTLTLSGDGSSIHDAFGNAFESSASVSFDLIEVQEDLLVDVDGVAFAGQGDQLTYTVIVSNDFAVGDSGVGVEIRGATSMENAQIAEIVATGGATTSLSAGAINGVIVDTVGLPAGSQIVYTLTGDVSIGGDTHQESAQTIHVTAQIESSSGFTDQVPFNNQAGAFTRIKHASEVDGALIDQGVLSSSLFKYSSYPVLGDFNGDGFLDILTGETGETFGCYLNDQQGGFGTRRVAWDGNGDADRVAVGDVDGDGDLDFVVLDLIPLSGGLYVAFNDGAANFTPGNQINSEPESYDFDLYLEDFDNDGDLDICFGSGLRLNDGAGNFGPEIDLETGMVHAVGDLNGNGELDLISEAGIHLQSFKNEFSRTQALSLGEGGEVALGDVDQDGDLDFVIASGNSRLFLNDGDGFFVESSSMNLAGAQASDVELADFNGDGWLDVLLMMASANELLYISDSSGGFLEASELATENSTYAAVGDLDQDGGLEIVMAATDLRIWSPDLAPKADAGDDVAVTTDSVQLNGGNSFDPEGGGFTYFWELVDAGTPIQIDNSTSVAPTLSGLSSDPYRTWEVRLTVTDVAGSSSSDIVLVEHHRIPVADAGSDQIVSGGSAILDGTGSYDPEGSDVSYLWSVQSGSGVSLEDVTLARPTVNGLVTGQSYVFLLTVTDGDGAQHSDTVSVYVSRPPVFNLGGDLSTVNDHFIIDLTSGISDPEGDALTYFWEQIDESNRVTIVDPTSATPLVEGLVEGESYSFRVTVTDEHGASATDVVTVNVPLAHYLDAGLGTLETPGVTQWGSHDITGGSVALKVVFDYSNELVAQGGLVSLLDLYGDESYGVALLHQNGQLLLLQKDPTGQQSFIQVSHGLTAPRLKVNVVVVLDLVGQERISLYIDGVKKREVIASFGDVWSETTTPSLGALDPQPDSIKSLPDENIYFAAYQLSGAGRPRGNTLESVIQASWKPVADAGEDQINVEGSVTLDATGSYDLDSNTLSYSWTKISGPAVTFDDPTLIMPTVSGLAPGESYIFQVQVTDEHGASDTAEVSVETVPPTAFEGWLIRQFPEEYDPELLEENADLDGDGVPNILAFVMDIKAADNQKGILLDQEESEALEMSFKRRSDAADLNLVIQYSDDCAIWHTAEHGVDGVSINVVEGAYGNDETGIPIDRVDVSIPGEGRAQMFTRIGVVIP